MLRHCLLLPDLPVDQLNVNIFGTQTIHTQPGMHIDALAQTQLAVATPIDVEFQTVPTLSDMLFPGCQVSHLRVVILPNSQALLDLRNVITGGIFLYHATHTELRGAGANSVFHCCCPAMRNPIGSSFKEAGDNLFLKQTVQRKAIGLGLDILIVVFTLLTNGPAVFAVVALGPPAVQDTAIGLPVERSLLTTGAAGLVRADRIIEPEICAGDEVASHVDIIVLQEDNFSSQLVAARGPINLLNQRLARFVGGMCLAREDNLDWTRRIVQQAAQAVDVAEEQSCAFIGGKAACETEDQRIGINQVIKLGDL